jgi:ABC-type multidrug transport system fused ATPase/permease subunit
VSPTRSAALLTSALLLAATAGGCGGTGTLGPKALQQEATGLQSLAAEGGILAGDAARGRSTSVFVRVHAQYLTTAAQSSASTLTAGGPAATSLATLAKHVAHDLDRLSRSGSDRAQQRRLAAALTRAASRAAKLGQQA